VGGSSAEVNGGPSRGRRRLFTLLVALLGLAGVEFGARVVELVQQRIAPPDQGETAFAVLANPVRAFERVVEGGRAEYRRTKAHWLPRRERFAAEKPEKGLRIFSLGGSAAMGWPHSDATSYAGILEQKLRALYPQRSVEVVNAAGNTYASFRVKVVLDEILEYEPDLVLIWSGNNEFVEDVVYGMVLPPWPWSHSALARIVHVATGRSRAAKPVIDIANYAEADHTVTRIGYAFGEASQLREDPAQLERVAQHYRANLESMVRAALDRGVPVALIDVPVNLKDWWPNVSIHRHSLDADERAAFAAEYRRGILALEAGDPEEAALAFAAASHVDGGYAEAHFLRGRALQALGRLGDAKDAYWRALEEDAHPFRDLPVFAATRREVASAHGIPLIDAPGAIARLAEDGIPGLDVLVDYVHPTVEANETIAHEVLTRLVADGLLPEVDPEDLSRVRVRVPADIEEHPRLLLKLFPQFLIMRQHEHIDGLAARILRATRPSKDDSPEDVRKKRELRKLIRDTRRVLADYRALLRAEKLGTLSSEYTPERARWVFATYVELIRQLEARELSSEDFATLVPEFPYGPTADATPSGDPAQPPTP
jgi:tetratricopeptide (TPR) repeat protein